MKKKNPTTRVNPSQWNDLGVWVSKQGPNYEKPYTETNPSLLNEVY